MIRSPRASVLVKWIEGALLLAGSALAIWCTVVLLEARYYARLPTPPAPAEETIINTPAVPGSPPAENVTPVSAGAWVGKLEAPSVGLEATVLEGTDAGTLRRA